MSREELDVLHERLRHIITTVCNTIGCKDCGLKYGENCQATDLQHRIYEKELEDI
jgi:hypothetical protein